MFFHCSDLLDLIAKRGSPESFSGLRTESIAYETVDYEAVAYKTVAYKTAAYKLFLFSISAIFNT